MRPPGRPPSLQADQIAAAFYDTEEWATLVAMRDRLNEVREQRGDVRASRRELRRDVLAPGAATELAALQQQENVLASVEAELAAAASAAHERAAERLREIERDACQRALTEAMATRDRIAAEFEGALDVRLEELSEAMIAIQRASLPTHGHNPHYEHLLGEPLPSQAEVAGEEVLTHA